MNDNSTDQTPTRELRAAATKLCETAKGATPGRWRAVNPIGREFGGLDFPIMSDHLLSSPPYVAYVDVSPQAAEFPQQIADAKADALWIALAGPQMAEPLAALLESEADRLEAEVTASLVDCANCYKTADCADPHPEALYHSEHCERVFEAPTDGNRDADWRCDCFDGSITVARAINGSAK